MTGCVGVLQLEILSGLIVLLITLASQANPLGIIGALVSLVSACSYRFHYRKGSNYSATLI